MVADCTYIWIAFTFMTISWVLAMVGIFFARKTIRLLRGP
jgi:predicted membrane channel-forming protein YqfA (hemolysin III family)